VAVWTNAKLGGPSAQCPHCRPTRTTVQQTARGQLTIRADRGTSMTSKPVASCSATAVTCSHCRPYTSTDSPYSEARFKTLKYRLGFPTRFDAIEYARAFAHRVLPSVLRLVQRPAPPLRDRAAQTQIRPPRPRPGDSRRTRQGARRACRGRDSSTPDTVSKVAELYADGMRAEARIQDTGNCCRTRANSPRPGGSSAA
jgi:hypothetical protein